MIALAWQWYANNNFLSLLRIGNSILPICSGKEAKSSSSWQLLQDRGLLAGEKAVLQG